MPSFLKEAQDFSVPLRCCACQLSPLGHFRLSLHGLHGGVQMAKVDSISTYQAGEAAREELGPWGLTPGVPIAASHTMHGISSKPLYLPDPWCPHL